MKKTDSYNKYVPLFIDNYAEQRSAKLRARMGWAGYGIYLAILQRLRSEKECVLELDYESLAFSFWTDEETLRTIIEDFGLFTINREKRCFFSPLLDEMLLSIDPALAKARSKKYAVQVPANEELASCFTANAAEKGCKVSENGVQVPANEELASCFTANAAENGCKVAENGVQVPANEELASCFAADAQEGDCEVSKSSVQVPTNEELASCFSASAAENGCKVAEKGMQVPANEELASCFAADAQEGDCEVLKSSVQVPANEELASSSHACVRVNKQTNEQTNERTNEQEKEERRKTSSLLVTKKGECRGAKVQRMTSDEENICEELSLFAKSCDVSSAKKESKAKTSANQSVRRKRASVRGHLLRTPVYLNPPTVEEVAAYAKYLGYTDFQADRFVAYYAANGWKTTRHDMMNWHAAVSTWHLNQCRYAEERAQQAQQKAQEKERRELQYQQDREWRNRVFLERNASQEQQDRLFHQQRQQFLQQQVVAAVTSVRDKYELPPEVPF